MSREGTGRRPALVLSCEHGGNRVPAGFPRDPELEVLLPTHRGWDPGALSLARSMARMLEAPVRYTTISRLVVETNRSEESPELYSRWSDALPPGERKRLLARYHRRHRQKVRRTVEAASREGRRAVVHVGVHTFTPVLDDQVRTVDVGILLDPARPLERRVARGWIRALRAAHPDLRIGENTPYDGRSDGLTTTLRSVFPEGGSTRYAGLELEVNQALLGDDTRFPEFLVRWLSEALDRALEEATSVSRS